MTIDGFKYIPYKGGETNDKNSSYVAVHNNKLTRVLIGKDLDIFLDAVFKNDFHSVFSKRESILSTLNKTFGNLEGITHFNVTKEGKLFVKYSEDGEDKEQVFNVLGEDGNEGIGEYDRQEYEKKIRQSVVLSEDIDYVIVAMGYIFEHYTGRLENDDDALDVDYFVVNINGKKTNLEGSSLTELQDILTQKFTEYGVLKSTIFGAETSADASVQSSKEKYLEYAIGIGDTYESGAQILDPESESVRALIPEIIAGKTCEECFEYLLGIHQKIDDNDYQSWFIEGHYKAYINILNEELFQKFKDDNASDDNFLKLSQIAIGESVKKMNGPSEGKKFYHDIDTLLISGEFSERITQYLIYKKGGLLDNINKTQKVEIIDEELEGKTPFSLIRECHVFFDKNIKTDGGDIYSAQLFFQHQGLDSLLKIREGDKYDDLDFIVKGQLGAIARLVKKMNRTHRTTSMRGYEGGAKIDSIYTVNSAWKEVYSDAINTIGESLEDNFEGTLGTLGVAQDSGDYATLTDTQKEIFDLYQKLNGNGLNLTLDNGNLSKSLVKNFAIPIAVAIGVVAIAPLVLPALGLASLGSAVASGSMIAIGMVGSVGGMVTSHIINPRGYESFLEGFVDLGTDFVTTLATGGIGGMLTSGIGSIVRGVLSKMHISFSDSSRFITGLGREVSEEAGKLEKIFNRNTAIFAGDFTVLGLASELGRDGYVADQFNRTSKIMGGGTNVQEEREKGEEVVVTEEKSIQKKPKLYTVKPYIQP